MKFISRDTDYAVRALLYIARAYSKDKDCVVVVDDIVKGERLPERFLRRILQKLARHKILYSYKGKDGGFSLSRSPKEIRFTDIINIFQGEIDLTNCLLKGLKCPNIKKCALRKKLKKISKKLSGELERITVASLLKG